MMSTRSSGSASIARTSSAARAGTEPAARQPDGVRMAAERFEVARDATKVVEASARHADAIEAEQPVDEHDGQGRPTLARSGNDPDPFARLDDRDAPASPDNDSDRESRQ